MKNIIILIFLTCSQIVLSQDFTILTQKIKYSESVVKNTKNFYFLGEFYIDKNKKNIIDLNTLEAGVNKVIQDINSSSLIVLDIENKIYQDIKTKSRKDQNYERNIQKLVEMVKLVKKMRPKSKVVLYGLPFNFNYDFQKKYNDFEKLKPLLNTVDYLSPSLYLMYSNKERDVAYFKNYIESNLELTFQYASKVNKDVLPFVWYKIHPYNKKYGGNIIDNKTYVNYLKDIKEYEHHGKKVKGIIYWDAQKQTIDIDNMLRETLKILD